MSAKKYSIYHDNDTLEIIDVDSGQQLDYLKTKLKLIKKIIEWMNIYNLKKIECSYVS